MAAIKAGVQPIIGCELAVTREGAEPAPGTIGRAPEPDKLVLLAQDEAGYANLHRAWSAESHLDTEAGRTPQVALEKLDGRTRRPDRAHRRARRARSGACCWRTGRARPRPRSSASKRLFPGRLYVEVMRHGVEDEDAIEGALLDLAYAHDLPLVATNEAYFADRRHVRGARRAALHRRRRPRRR